MSDLGPDNDEIIGLTVEVVAAFVRNNSMPAADLPILIQSVHSALAGLGSPRFGQADEATAARTGAVGERASIKPDHLLSMIDGKPYKMLRRHLTGHGYTPESYRAAFGLKPNYPMVAANYAEQRRALAHKIGLGRKSGTAS